MPSRRRAAAEESISACVMPSFALRQKAAKTGSDAWRTLMSRKKCVACLHLGFLCIVHSKQAAMPYSMTRHGRQSNKEREEVWWMFRVALSCPCVYRCCCNHIVCKSEKQEVMGWGWKGCTFFKCQKPGRSCLRSPMNTIVMHFHRSSRLVTPLQCISCMEISSSCSLFSIENSSMISTSHSRGI